MKKQKCAAPNLQGYRIDLAVFFRARKGITEKHPLAKTPSNHCKGQA
jgi:hypothetical protein